MRQNLQAMHGDSLCIHPVKTLLSVAIAIALSSQSAYAEINSTPQQEKNKTQSADSKEKITTDKSVKPVNSKEAKNTSNDSEIMDEMVVTGEIVKDSHFTSPSTRVDRAHIERQNAQTTEEAVKYQPSLQIRQRYIGDPNGVLGIRGADMFSTARNMVYADGLPLHNFLQSTFNGAPRWSLVGPNEIDAVDIVYGPFSAEYSGNSVGGVVNLKTHMPMKEEYYMEGSYFVQPYKFYGKDAGDYQGNRQYFSYGNRKNDLSMLLSYNRLEAESQPMSYFIDNTGLGTPKAGAQTVDGAVPLLDTRGTPSYIYGDTGPEKVRSDLMKIKLAYDISPDLQTIFTGAFEERSRKAVNPRTYLNNTSNGSPYYGDNSSSSTTGQAARDAIYNGTGFNVANSGFGAGKDFRQTMQLGWQVKGAISKNWDMDSTLSYFDVLTDKRSTAFFSPNDPLFQNTGQLQVFDDFNWKNYDLKLSTKGLFGIKPVDFIGGYHFDNYNLSFKQFDFANVESIGRRNKGETTTNAIYGQFAYHFMPDWDLTLGARYEWWQAQNGLAANTRVADRDDQAISPKASIGFEPNEWKFRYSFGRAYRFPVIAELYQSLSSPTSITTANASLNPEDGWHQNFMIEYGLDDGYVRVNVFRDDIRNTIQSVRRASGALTVSALQNIPETSTTGVELIYDQQRIFGSNFDVNFNSTWMSAIVEDGGSDLLFTEANGTQSRFNLTGKERIRLPEWRFNVFTTYHVTQAWDVSMAARYTNDSFNDIDNKDMVNGVFGAQDGFFFLDMKTNYRFKPNLLGKDTNSRVSFGINNLTDDTAFVFHPYPQRTFFVEGALSF